jgi:hypothetical protein
LGLKRRNSSDIRFWFNLDAGWVGNTKLLDLASNRIDNK